MDAYLSKFGITYYQFLGIRYIYGGTLPTDINFMPSPAEIRGRYCRGLEVPDNLKHVLKDIDHQIRYINGGTVPPMNSMFFSDAIYKRRYWNGHAIPDNMQCILRNTDYNYRYCLGHEIPIDKLNILDDLAHRCRFSEDFEIPDNKMSLVQLTDRVNRYRHGGAPVAGLTADDHAERVKNGYYVDQRIYVANVADMTARMWAGYDPEIHDYYTSLLLGYRVPDHVKLALTERDLVIRQNWRLNEAGILALAGLEFTVSRSDLADFEYAFGRPAASFRNFRD